MTLPGSGMRQRSSLRHRPTGGVVGRKWPTRPSASNSGHFYGRPRRVGSRSLRLHSLMPNPGPGCGTGVLPQDPSRGGLGTCPTSRRGPQGRPRLWEAATVDWLRCRLRGRNGGESNGGSSRTGVPGRIPVTPSRKPIALYGAPKRLTSKGRWGISLLKSPFP